MEEQDLLADFFAAIENDARISITHIGIYSAVLRYWQLAGRANPFPAYSYQIIKIAKISAKTYHKIIRDLSAYGYLRYEPSFKRNQASRVFLLI
ncbi:hypothetical protein ACFS5N_05655 [Mucilaginibacter ximonensis]|uniref:Helix-turn-helix domain-containing protein n=1 Tax=Mucilaginibacter ximonensis TaxID=538021 RepID=A0ABW5Y9F9_9SPHI